MGSQTPTLALPYPVGTDRVMDGDNAMQALAEAVEAQLLKTACGKYTGTTDSAGNLVFAHGLGVVPRCVLGSGVLGALAWIANPYTPGITATNVHFVCRSHDGTNLASQSVTVFWMAVA